MLCCAVKLIIILIIIIITVFFFYESMYLPRITIHIYSTDTLYSHPRTHARTHVYIHTYTFRFPTVQVSRYKQSPCISVFYRVSAFSASFLFPIFTSTVRLYLRAPSIVTRQTNKMK